MAERKKPAAETTAVATIPTAGDDQLPAFLQGMGQLGLDQIDNKDVAIPRIKLGQGTSDEVKDKDFDVALGDFFLNIDGEVLCKQGEELDLYVVAYTTEYILWRDRKFNGGGLMARAPRTGRPGAYEHVWNKPNQKFENKLDGRVPVVWETGRTVELDGLGEWGSEDPNNPDSGIAATKHHNYVVYIPSEDMIAALSLSKSGASVARNFNAALRKGGRPIFAHVVKLSSFLDTNPEGEEFYNYRLKKGPVIQDEQLALKLKALFDQFSGGFTVDQSDEGEAGGAAKADGDTF